MKKASIIFLLIAFSRQLSGQTSEQGIRFSVNQMTKSKLTPAVNMTVDIIINDTAKYAMTSDAKGYLGLINLKEGQYKIKIDRINLDRNKCDCWGTQEIVVRKNEVSNSHVTYACGNNRLSLEKQDVKDSWYTFFHIIIGLITRQPI
jgi:hypothetical protein